MSEYNYDFWAKKNEYAAGGAKEQQMIGSAIDKSIAERRLLADRAEAKRNRQLQRDILNYNQATKMAENLDTLNFMPTAGVKGMDEVMVGLGRSIADQAAYLNSELARTQDTASYSAAMARLKSEVTAAKGFDGKIKELLGTYEQAVQSGNLSDFTDANTRAVIEDLRSGSPEGRFENINGVTTWVGKNALGEDYKLAMSQVDQLKNQLQQKDDINTLIDKGLSVQQTADGHILSFDEPAYGKNNEKGLSAADLSNNMLVDLVNSAGAENKERKSAAILVDHFGYDKKEALKLFSQVIPEDERTAQEKADGIVTVGDQLLQREWLNKSKNLYGINQAAVQKYKESAEDQYQQHYNAKDIQKQLRADRAQTKNALANDNDPRFWNTPINNDLTNLKGMPPKEALTKFNGLMQRFKGDLALLGLSNTEIKLGDGTVVPAVEFEDEEGNTVKQEGYLAAGPPVSMVIQNPKVPGAPAIEIPFNASPEDIKRAIFQAQGLQSPNSRIGLP